MTDKPAKTPADKPAEVRTVLVEAQARVLGLVRGQRVELALTDYLRRVLATGLLVRVPKRGHPDPVTHPDPAAEAATDAPTPAVPAAGD